MTFAKRKIDSAKACKSPFYTGVTITDYCLGKKRGGGAERSQPPRFVRRSSQSASGLQIEIAQLIYKVVVGDFAGTGINEGSEGSLGAAVVGQ